MATIEELAASLQAKHGARVPTAWGYDIPGVLRNVAGAGAGVSLTLDGCGGGCDRRLLAHLREQDVPATLFVTDIWLAKNPVRTKAIVDDGWFELAAHGSKHRPASVNGAKAYGIKGTASVADLVREVETNVRRIADLTGVRPRFFRPGTAFCDDVAVDVIRELGLEVAGFAVSGDRGATLSPTGVKQRLLGTVAGDIVLCHFNKPLAGTRVGIRRALPALRQAGLEFRRLRDLVPLAVA